MKPEEIRSWSEEFRKSSQGEFQINLWIPESPPARDFEARCHTMLTIAPKVISSIMGLYDQAFVAELKARRPELWYSLRADDFAYTPPMRPSILTICRALILALAAAGSVFAQANPDWTEPFPPFRIAGNLYYVGSKGLANYLVTTPQGNILINSDLEANVPLIRASVEKLGFKFEDIKILLISHAHWDHCAGSALIKRLTGAKYMVMDADVPEIEAGGKGNFQYGDNLGSRYQPTKVDRILHDGDEVRLGGTVLVAHLTPGHTKGTTTWTMKVADGGKTYNAVIIGSPNVNAGYKLVHNRNYPQIARDSERMGGVLSSCR